MWSSPDTRRTCGHTTWSSASICARDRPAGSRAINSTQIADRLVRTSDPIDVITLGASVIGTMTSVGEPTTTPANSGGVTPTIVNGSAD